LVSVFLKPVKCFSKTIAELGNFLQSGIGDPCLFVYIPPFPKSTKEKDL
jgi:hypothetical protein